jgi:NTE family protein
VRFRNAGYPKVGLALGGGGARGGIHVGVLKVLEDEGIPIHCVAGTSIGALVGALYALTLSARSVERRLLEYLESETFGRARFSFMSEASEEKKLGLFTRIAAFIKKEFLLSLALSRPYLISRERFLESLTFFLPDARVEDTKIPFAAVAADLETGEEVVIREGPLLDAVYASSTYPGVVEAVRFDSRLLVDGGIVDMVPVQTTRDLGADVVIGVNAERGIHVSLDGLSGIEIVFRADDILGNELTRCKSQDADILVHPQEGEAKWYEFQKTPAYIHIGEKAALGKIPEIHKAIKKRRQWRLPIAIWGR